jgi:hypothetical protein
VTSVRVGVRVPRADGVDRELVELGAEGFAGERPPLAADPVPLFEGDVGGQLEWRAARGTEDPAAEALSQNIVTTEKLADGWRKIEALAR